MNRQRWYLVLQWTISLWVHQFFFHLRFHLLGFTLYLKTKLQFSLVSGFVTIFRHSRVVLKDFVCESVFISALRFLFCSNHKRCRTVYFTKNYTKIEILAIWKVSDLYPNPFQSGLPGPWMSQNHGHALVHFLKTRVPDNGPESDLRHLYQIP